MSKPKSIQLWPDHDLRISAHYQLIAEQLISKTVEESKGTISSTGALIIKTGKFTGRSPKDKYIVKDDITTNLVWWGDINIPFSSKYFDVIYKKMMTYMANKTVYVRDVFAGADKRYRIGIRIVNEKPWANLFVRNMFIQPDESTLNDFS